MLPVVAVFSFVYGSVLPFEDSPTLHAALIERTLVFSMRQREPSFSLEEILLEIAFIDGTVWKEIAPLSMFGSIQEIAFVVSTILPFLFALPVWQIIQPFTNIGIVLLVIHKFSFSLSHIMPNLSLIVAATTEDVSPVSMCESVCEGAVVVGAVFEEKFTYAMRLVILPLSLIDGLSGFDEKGWSWVALHPT